MNTKTAPDGSQKVPLLYVKDGDLKVLSSVTEYENGEEIDRYVTNHYPGGVKAVMTLLDEAAPTGPDVEAALLCTGHIVEIAARDQREVTTRNGVEIDNSLVIAITP